MLLLLQQEQTESQQQSQQQVATSDVMPDSLSAASQYRDHAAAHHHLVSAPPATSQPSQFSNQSTFEASPEPNSWAQGNKIVPPQCGMYECKVVCTSARYECVRVLTSV